MFETKNILSPFFFTFVDALSRLVLIAVNNGLVKGLTIGGEQVLTSHV